MTRSSAFAWLLLSLLALAALAVPRPASAAIEPALEELAGRKFSARLEAIATIRDSAHPRVAAPARPRSKTRARLDVRLHTFAYP